MAIGLAVALASGISGLTPWRLGVWGTSEANGLLLHAGALLAALGLALAARAWPGAVAAALRAPIVLVPAALSIWSALVAPAAEYPWLSIFGAPQTSEGALLYLDMAIWAAATVMLRDAPQLGRLVAGVALVTALALTLLFLNEGTRIYFYPDWLAFFGLFVPAIVVGLGAAPPGWRLWALALFGAALPLAISRNYTAIFGAVLAATFAFAAFAAVERRPYLGRWWRPVMAMLAAAIPCLGLAAIWLTGSAGLAATMWSRMLALKVAFAALAEAPQRWLMGTGWGHDIFSLLRGIGAVGQTGLEQSWDLAARDYFHSHHGALEALVSAGLPGAVLFAAWPVAAIVGAEPRWRGLAAAAALAYAITVCFWFQSAPSFAFQAVAFAALVRRPVVPAWRPAVTALVPMTAVLVLGGAIAFLLPFGIAAQRQIVEGDVRLAVAPGQTCAEFPQEAWRGHLGLARLYASSIYGVEHAARRDGWSPGLLARLQSLVCLAERRSDEQASVYLLFWGLDLRGRVAHLGEFAAAKPSFGTLLENWAARLDTFGALAPDRSDVAVGYYGWAIATGRGAEAVALGNRWLARRPNDAISLWFSGNAMLFEADERIARQGAARMRQALALGVDRMIPIDPGIRRGLDAVSR